MSRGIDYSGPGAACNRDPESGIRYGVIPIGSLAHWAWEVFEADYGDPRCPKCGGEVVQHDEETHWDYEDHVRSLCREHACESCEVIFDTEHVYRNEPLCHNLDGGVYQGRLDPDNDVWVFKSPYYTRAAFCSPCAPGACSLSSSCDDGERAYCFGHDWFEGGVAPYPVYRVDNNEEVRP